MKEIRFPYGRGKMTGRFEDNELLGTLVSSVEEYCPEADGETLVKRALEAPIGSPTLSELARGKKKIVVIASDHTRPVPSRIIMPAMLEELRKGNPSAEITILIATGCHRGTTAEELTSKFGPEITERERIVIHDCDDEEMLTDIGTLPSGAPCVINKLAAEADLLVAEGFIEPHLFAGFSGGRKSVLPGISSRKTVMGNHCSEFLAHPLARTGSLDGNPIHEDMLWAAQAAGLAFIVNVVLNQKKEVIYAVAGDPVKAHRQGTDFLSSLCRVKTKAADIVITTNGGYPLDQNVYQAAKGMTAGEAAVREGGVIIMLAASEDGTGGEHFFRELADEPDTEKAMARMLSRDRRHTVPDQWQAQIILRVLLRARVIYVSQIDDELVKKMHMIPAHSLEEAMRLAKSLLGCRNASVVAIPDGISVIPEVE